MTEFVAYRSCEQVALFQSWDAPYPRDEGERFTQQLAKEHPDTAGEWFQFAVALRRAGQLIGDCAAMPHADDVPLEYSIEQLICAVASRLDAGMVG